MQNPFSLSFGNSPYSEIDRSITDFNIIEDFNQEHSISHAYMITGVRGSGKTVYFYFENRPIELAKIENKYCNYLGEYVYEKILSELSGKDRLVVTTMIDMEDVIRVKDLRDKLGIDSSKFSHYRDRLKRKGIVNITDYGYISFSLPYFREFIRKAYME